MIEWDVADKAWLDVVRGLRALLDGEEERAADLDHLSRELEQLYDDREELTVAGSDTRVVDRRIRDAKRRLRQGPQLHVGEFLADGRFKLVERLGHGGFATVWKAYDRRSGRLVALKVLHGQHSEDRSKRAVLDGLTQDEKLDERSKPARTRASLAAATTSDSSPFLAFVRFIRLLALATPLAHKRASSLLTGE